MPLAIGQMVSYAISVSHRNDKSWGHSQYSISAYCTLWCEQHWMSVFVWGVSLQVKDQSKRILNESKHVFAASILYIYTKNETTLY